ncbi:PREDICTED: CDT1-like protein b [Tarenaya hassleriana]|uniref:CDT1-like protein b n=1 Tax=Tarenaya hassleriana TaxID=28532 RepID=UPI00053C46A6|nr:PREDICTED: CDT1-like protein b [Tarenaya hassleriana]
MSSSEFVSETPELGSEKPVKEPKSSNLDLVLSTKTPDKPASLLGRSRNSDVSVSLRYVRRPADTGLRLYKDRTGQIKSAKRQILSSPRKSEGSVKLPERFEILGDFFNGLDTSIRLLKLRGCLTTFTNISPKIECLTNRRILYAHLAQMKHIFPEAIQIKRVLKYDEGTCCTNPDLHITLNTDAIPYDESKHESKNMALRNMFRKRLSDFFRAHPKGEIPEEMLPEPFNPSKTSRVQSLNIPENSVEQDHHGLSVVAATSTNAAEFLAAPTCTESTILATPTKDSSVSSKDMASTPVQHASTPARLMSATPALQPSKRCIMLSPDDDSIGSPKKLVRRPSRTRSLRFEEDGKADDEDTNGEKFGVNERKSCDKETDEEAEEEVDEKINEALNVMSDASNDNDEDDDLVGLLPESLLQSIKEREKAAAKERDPAISLAKRRRRIIAGLPKLFNLIHFLFQSTRRTTITKEELLYKIIAGQINTTDKKEVEEQLSVMLELVPEWISETKASSGDLLVRINKMSEAEVIRARLGEATMPKISTDS